jgi:hypothetical protein
VRVHVTTVFVCALVGFLLGCFLHALPWTAGLLYTDLIAMNVAAILAATCTTMLVFRGFRPPQKKTSTPSKAPKWADDICVQPLITGDRQASFSRLQYSAAWKLLGRRRISLEETSVVARGITTLFQTAREQAALDSTPELRDILDVAWHLWKSRSILISFVDRKAYIGAGIHPFCSISRVLENGQIDIVVGMFGNSELDMSSWAVVHAQTWVNFKI